MTVEEALAASVVEPVNDIFEIDPETRTITVPVSEIFIITFAQFIICMEVPF